MRFSSFASILVLAFVPITAFGQTLAPSVASLTRSQTVQEGRKLSLSVSADGTTPFTFQWSKDGTAIPGATSSSYAIDPVLVTHEGSYTVTITNSVGSTTSDPILIAVTPAEPPSFYYQPTSATFTVGDSLSLYAYVSGTTPMTIQWRKDGEPIAGATSQSFSKANASASDAGIYTVTATNLAGTATSNGITVTAAAAVAPSFTRQPSNLTADLGSSPWIDFNASGTQPLTYELLKGDSVVTSNTWGSLYFPTITDASAGTYRIRLTNSAGTVTSNTFTVTVNPPRPPKVSVSSSTVRLVVGQSLYLSAYVYDGTDPMTYQWYKDGVAIGGATNYSYSKSNIQATDTGNYTVTVTNAAGSATSGAINVAVSSLRAPLITSHPTSGSYRAGEWVSIWVGASGDQLTYQWHKDGVAIPGATSSSYYFGNSFSAAHAGSYTAKVTNTVGTATSEAAVLSVLPAFAPIISGHPASQSVRSGESVGFEVQYEAHPSPTFQWNKDGVAIAGATSSYFSIYSPAASDAGTYTVTLTNSEGSATSSGAVLSVSAPTVPVITRHPSSASLLPGGYHTLGVGLQHGYGVTYQWNKDGVAIVGATSDYYYIHSAQPSQAGSYTVTVTSSAGSVTSESAEVRVDTNATRPVITFSTGSAAVASGNSVGFSIGTSVTPTSIQWYLDGVAIPNRTSSELYFTAAASAVGAYTAVVTTTSGTVTSREMKLTLLASAVAPAITSQPKSQSVEPGGYVSFWVNTLGESPLNFQWRKDGTNIPLATGYYLSWNATSNDAGTYSVVVTNAHGSVTSADATLTVRPAVAPTITTHPASKAVSSSSSSFSLSVSVIGTRPLTYQWRKDGVNIAGATDYYLSRSVNAGAAGKYSVVVTNSVGTATSQEANITLVDVATGPVFTGQPAAASAYAGATATFTGAPRAGAPSPTSGARTAPRFRARPVRR